MKEIVKYSFKEHTKYIIQPFRVGFKVLNNLYKILSNIDNIIINEEKIHIKLKKNLFIETEGSIITSTKGMNIMVGKEIHLNPPINSEEIKLLD